LHPGNHSRYAYYLESGYAQSHAGGHAISVHFRSMGMEYARANRRHTCAETPIDARIESFLALGSVAPAAFIAKSEIASWPVLGLMCKAAGCLFIDRKTSRTLQNKKLLDAAVKFGDIIGLFPEGTTDDGTELLPFKTSLFSIAEHKDMEVQPVSIM
jgi:1-acyl-sn-glycerol-3-phosphate acyltransferase